MTKRTRKTNAFERRLAATATPVFVLDAERRVRAFNAGCEALTGFSAGEVVGEICPYASTAETAGVQALVAGLCPPPDAFAGQEVNVPAYIAHREGDALPRLLHYFPLRDEDDRVTGVLGLILPIRQPAAATPVSPARQLHAELAALRISLRNRFGPNSLVCRSAVMSKVLAQLQLAQQCAAFVLLEGEAGAGKEHLARVIHFGSPAKANWFVPLDCRRLGPEELSRVLNRLLEVHQPRPLAGPVPQPGTVYLADVEFLPRDLQQLLATAFAADDPARRPPLRLLASTSSQHLTVEADTNSPPSPLAVSPPTEAAPLRPDFLALVSTLTIQVPPLRQRGDDLPLLAQHFLEEANRESPTQKEGFDESIWPLFHQYRWPGNLDELAAVIRDAHAQSGESLIKPHDLPFRFRSALDAQLLSPPAEALPLPLDPLLTKVETQLITLALERSKYNKSKAAELLGINRARLLRRIVQLGIEDLKAAAGSEGQSIENA